MKVIHGLDEMSGTREPVVLAAGFFDGVHRGHVKLIRQAQAKGKKIEASTWVMTFDTHPMKVLKPEKAPLLLTSTEHKLHLLRLLGIAGCVVIPFTTSLSHMKPEAFIEMLKHFIPSLRLMFVGRNWTFGHEGRGSSANLKSLARLHGFDARVIPSVCWRGNPVSSTRIRRDIAAGRLRDAETMLGRPVSIWGTVIRGKGLGRKLGAPTANLDPHDEVYPPNGVYTAHAVMGGKTYPGVLNLGTRPTLHEKPAPGAARPERVLELHLLDAGGNLYRRRIEVCFFKKLRNERTFASLEALKTQIREDFKLAQRELGKRHGSLPAPPL